MKRSVLAIVQLLAPPAFAADAFFSGVGDLPGGDPVSFVNAVSADGSLVVGGSNAEKLVWVLGELRDVGRRTGFVWTQGGGIQEIAGSTTAFDASALGHVVGEAGNNAYRWSQADGFEVLTGIGEVTSVGGASADGSAIAVSDDGNTVLGGGDGGYWTWTAATGMVALAPHATEFVEAHRLSPDGSAHVGTLKPLDSAYLWTPDDGYVLIDSVTAHAVSADARVVVGGSNWALPGTFDAFIWDAANGTAT